MSGQNGEFIHEMLISFFDFLHYSTPSIDDQLSFAAKNTISKLEPVHLSIYGKNTKQEIEKLGQWGSELNQNPEQTLSEHIENAFLNIHTQIKISSEENFFRCKSQSYLPKAVSLTALPANTSKCFFALTKNEPSSEEIFMLKCIASVISLKYKFEESKPETFKQTAKNKNRGEKASGGLTPRQMIILEGILKGYTNRRISEEIGFSESLVRQETVSIFNYFDVSGRAELMKIEHPES